MSTADGPFCLQQHDKSVARLESVYPELKGLSYDLDKVENALSTMDLKEAIRQYIYALLKLGRSEEAQAQIDHVCGFYRSSSDAHIPNKRDLFATELSPYFDCLIYDGDIEEAIAVMDDLYFNQGRKQGWPWLFRTSGTIALIQDEPLFQSFKAKVDADLALERQQVIAYLKRSGDWQEEWGTVTY